MKLISTSIAITASPARVWDVLTRFHEYHEWNPFMRSVSGLPAVGATLDVIIRPSEGKELSFHPKISVVRPNQELRWKGRFLVPGLFDGEHFFFLSATDEGTLLQHGEQFSGVLVQLLGSFIFGPTERGFVRMNEAIKSRAESEP
jgi:hypothetical protein